MEKVKAGKEGEVKMSGNETIQEVRGYEQNGIWRRVFVVNGTVFDPQQELERKIGRRLYAVSKDSRGQVGYQ